MSVGRNAYAVVRRRRVYVDSAFDVSGDVWILELVLS
jgi:hypothetical protein